MRLLQFGIRSPRSDRKGLRIADGCADIVIKGAREHNLRRRRPDAAAQPADLPDRRQRLGQKLAGVRHALCRRAAALRREPVQLRPAVPGPDAQARRRLHQRPEPVDLDLAEIVRPEPALDRRHDHRDLRLPPRAVRPRRPGALPASATGRSRPRRASRSSPASCRLPAGTQFAVLAPVIRGQKGEYNDLFDDLLQAGLRAGPRRRHGSCRSPTTCSLDRQMRHNIEVVIDRLAAGDVRGRGWPRRSNWRSSIGKGNLIVASDNGDERTKLRAKPRRLPPIEPKRPKKTVDRRDGESATKRRAAGTQPGDMHPLGPLTPARTAASASSRPARSSSASTARRACASTCDGLGEFYSFDPDLLVPDTDNCRSSKAASS